MSANHATPAYLSARQAAAFVGVSDKTVRDWIAAGKLPASRGRRQLRILRADLELFRDPKRPAETDATAHDAENADRGNANHADHAMLEPADHGREQLREAFALIERQQQTILELSGRCGYFQAQLEQASETIRALEAPVAMETNAAREAVSRPSTGVWWRLAAWFGG